MPSCGAPITLFWGDFQSVAQLGAALNAAFATLGGFLGNDVDQEERRIRLTIKQISATQPKVALTVSSVTVLRGLSGSGEALYRQFESVLNRLIRPACVLGMVLGFILLVVSAFFYQTAIPPFGIGLMVLSLMPFILGVIYAISMLGIFYFRISRPRQKLRIEHGLGR